MTILQQGICGPYELFTVEKESDTYESRGICGIIMRGISLVGSWSFDCREEWRKVRNVAELESWISNNQASKTIWR